MTNIYYASNIDNNINDLSSGINKQKLVHKFELMKKNEYFSKQDYINIYKLLKYKTKSNPTETPTSIIFNINKINDCILKLLIELFDFCKNNKIEKQSSTPFDDTTITSNMEQPIKLIIKKKPIKLRILTPKSQDISLENRITIPDINKIRENSFSTFFTSGIDEIAVDKTTKLPSNKKKELGIRQLLSNKKKELKKNNEGTRHVYVSVTTPCNDMSENYYNTATTVIEDTSIEDRKTSIEDEDMSIECEVYTSIEDDDDTSIESGEEGYSVEKIKHIIKK